MRADVDAARTHSLPAAAAPGEGRLGLTRAPETGDRRSTTALGDRAEGVVIP